MITESRLIDYAQRRQDLASKLPPGALAIIPAAGEMLRNGDASYRFRQDSDFYYLTGFQEPDAVLIIHAGQAGTCLLFNRSQDPESELWTGKRLGQAGAVEVLGVQEAFPIESLTTRLVEILANKTTVYCLLGRHPLYEKKMWAAIETVKGQGRKGISAPHTVSDLAPLLSEMRLIKTPAEIALMQKAADISVLGHLKAMKTCRHLVWEYEVEAELLYEFNRYGCRGLAYDPIVGGGANSCVLHYTQNNQRLHAGELLLIDAAGEFENYAADITRTFPVSGQFSGEQRAIYELVLAAQTAGIACIKPGTAWDQIQKTIVHVLTSGLCDLGILKGSVEDLIEKQAYRPFYAHNSGHWLGLDVHDVGAYRVNGHWRVLEPGMVLTVEPGLYIRSVIPGVHPRWWNIGVRIEDDILVTAEGPQNLTQALPSGVDEIEALMRD